MITLALIGVGKWGENYLKTASLLGGCSIKYVCAKTKAALNSLPSIYQKVYSANDLLKYKDIDGIIIATPAKTHFSLVHKFLLQGSNILVEKPLTTNYKDALKLYKTWQIKKPKVLVGHTFLYNPAYEKCKNILKDIGTIESVEFQGIQSPIRNDLSVIWDWGPHPVSIMMDLINKPIKEVIVTKKHSNLKKIYVSIEATLKFINGVRGVFRISWTGVQKIRKLTINGSKLKIVLDDTNEGNKKISLYKSGKLIKNPDYKPASALTKELKYFINAISKNWAINSDLKFGIDVIKILDALEESARRGKKIIIN